MIGLRRRGALLLAAVVALGAGVKPAPAQSRGTEHTLVADEGAPRPRATIDDVAWLQGRWIGTGLGSTAEEVWLPPAGGAMPGVFRLIRDGSVELYEMALLLEREGSLVFRLKHFEPDLTGWEEKAESVDFVLVRRDEDALWFDGLTVRREGPDRMKIWVALGSRDGPEVREALFEYRRARESPGDGS